MTLWRLLAVVAGGATIGTGAYVLGTQDIIEVVDASGTPVQVATVMVTGNEYGGCHCNVGSGPKQEVGHMTPGPSQVAVLTEDHALYFDPKVKWSYGKDTYTAPLAGRISVPLRIWKLSRYASTIERDVEFAKERLLAEQTGLELSETIRDVTSISKFEAANCLDAHLLAKEPDPDDPTKTLFDPKAVNVYYVPSCGESCSMAGLSCPDPRVNFVYTTNDESVLLHEVGHALLGAQGALHWRVSVSTDNIMQDSGKGLRKTLSMGQAITMNYEATSVLSTLGRQPLSLRCLVDCPKVEFDDSWSGCTAPPQLDAPPLEPLDAWLSCIECSDGQLSRLLTATWTDNAVFSRLVEELLPIGQQKPTADDGPYAANNKARHQRRAVQALEAMARRGHSGAKTAIERAHGLPPETFRGDVRTAIEQSYAATR
jgi:hypothetical protein